MSKEHVEYPLALKARLTAHWPAKTSKFTYGDEGGSKASVELEYMMRVTFPNVPTSCSTSVRSFA